MKKITEKTKLAEVMNTEKGAAALSKFNVPCLSCPMAQAEASYLEIGQVCMTYGIDLKKLLAELNK